MDTVFVELQDVANTFSGTDTANPTPSPSPVNISAGCDLSREISVQEVVAAAANSKGGLGVDMSSVDACSQNEHQIVINKQPSDKQRTTK